MRAWNVVPKFHDALLTFSMALVAYLAPAKLPLFSRYSFVTVPDLTLSCINGMGSHDVSTFLNQNNHKLPFFLHELIAFYEQASSRNS